MVQPNGARRRVGTQATGSRNCSISRATVAGSSKIATWPMPASHSSYAVGMAARKRDYLQAKAAGDLARVQAKFDTPILIIGDFNDEPGDTSVLTNLQASSELDRVVGKTNRVRREAPCRIPYSVRRNLEDSSWVRWLTRSRKVMGTRACHEYRWSCPDARSDAPGDRRDMAKAVLPESQSPAMQVFIHRKGCLKPVPHSVSGYFVAGRNLRVSGDVQ